MTISTRSLEILHHTLGLRPDRRIPFRNHYVASQGHDELPNLRLLEQAGLMKQAKTPAFCNHEDMVFVCTDAGKEYAVDNLPPEPPKPKRSNYRDYIDADCGFSFAEWLNINKPRVEARHTGKSWEYRMYRNNRLYTWGALGAVSGDWASTKKEAKASYKAALKKLKGGAA